MKKKVDRKTNARDRKEYRKQKKGDKNREWKNRNTESRKETMIEGKIKKKHGM